MPVVWCKMFKPFFWCFSNKKLVKGGLSSYALGKVARLHGALVSPRLAKRQVTHVVCTQLSGAKERHALKDAPWWVERWFMKLFLFPVRFQDELSLISLSSWQIIMIIHDMFLLVYIIFLPFGEWTHVLHGFISTCCDGCLQGSTVVRNYNFKGSKFLWEYTSESPSPF